MRHTNPPNQTRFFEQVWNHVRTVPHGKVVTYGQIAQLIGAPDGVDPQTYQAYGSRWVGSAMAACPSDVPWQRVINAQGKISQRAGAQTQQQLLEAEGVEFVNGKVNLKRFQWHGDDAPDAPQQLALF